MKTLTALLAVVLLAGCCSILDPLGLPDRATEVPREQYRVLWNQVTDCSGSNTDIETVSFYLVPDLDDAGRYERLKHRILLDSAWFAPGGFGDKSPGWRDGMLRHEMLHAHGVKGHPKWAVDQCGGPKVIISWRD